MTDIAVVGAGAAGLFSAIFAARQNPDLRVILLDSRQKIGAKILISGGTRCNVTNRRVQASDYEGGPRHFIQHVLEAFTPQESIQFFSEIGVDLVLEPTGKYFPTTHSGKTVLEALVKELRLRNVELRTGSRIDSIECKDGRFHLSGGLTASRVILATGGLSLPETGSDGQGLRMAQSLGHSLIATAPALTPLLSDDRLWADLSGVALDVKLSFYLVGKKKAESEGAMLFTHFGFSGPAVLDISRHVARASLNSLWKIEANFLPRHSEEQFYDALERSAASAKSLKNFLASEFGLPSRFCDKVSNKTLQGKEWTLKNLPRAMKRDLAGALFRYPLEVTGVYGYKKAEVTSGGVDLKEVKVKNMESKIVPGLYFAGEILDVDGRIGGFNFQWAWSSGALAGRSAAKASA